MDRRPNRTRNKPEPSGYGGFIGVQQPLGSFVWFPEGMTMYHGATEDSDCLMLFITNKPFNIRYTFEDEPGGSDAERAGREKACLCSMASVT